MTSGIEGVYPPGLPVAVVSKIERNAAYSFARITGTPSAGPGSDRQVLVLARLSPLPEYPEPGASSRPKGRKPKKGR